MDSTHPIRVLGSLTGREDDLTSTLRASCSSRTTRGPLLTIQLPSPERVIAAIMLSASIILPNFHPVIDTPLSDHPIIAT
jgi:hypothetical protein